MNRRAFLVGLNVRHRSDPVIEDRGIDRSATMTGSDKKLPVRRFGTSLTKTSAVLVAGCRADQTSADAWIDGDYHGALTYSLWRALRVPQLEGPTKLISSPVFGGT